MLDVAVVVEPDAEERARDRRRQQLHPGEVAAPAGDRVLAPRLAVDDRQLILFDDPVLGASRCPESGTRSCELVGDPLGDHVVVQALGAALLAVAALLDPARGRLGHRTTAVVDREDPGLEPVLEAVGGRRGVGEAVGGQPVGQAVGELERLIEVAEGDHRRDRAERLLAHDARVSGTSVSTVGSKNQPGPSIGEPP